MPPTSMPNWVESQAAEPGSIDPLGYLARREQLADGLLPGVTVATVRVRYLSFLCWAIDEFGNNDGDIDRWEIALSVGEHLRHNGDVGNSCRYLGRNLLQGNSRRLGAPVPRRLHVQTARLIYSGLLVSCGLVDQDKKEPTELGKRVAKEFRNNKRLPKKLPKQICRCKEMPCLTKIRKRERDYLRQGLLEIGEDAKPRARTFKEIGVRRLRAISRDGVIGLLSQYLDSPTDEPGKPASLLHAAAKLELQAMPLTRLFLELYRNNGTMGRAAPNVIFERYRVREAGNDLLADVVAHLRYAKKLGDKELPTRPRLKDWLRVRHREEAKPDAPWVREDWRPLRYGLAPQQPPGVHEYRLRAFSSLLSDLEVVR